MPSKFNSTGNKPGKAVKKGYARGGMAHDKRVLRNLDDEVYRIAPKERMGGAEGRDARDERRRINREKAYEKRHMNKGGKVKKQGYNDRLDESLGARDGKKSQSLKSRRDESKGMEKAMGKGAYSGASTMMADGGEVPKKQEMPKAKVKQAYHQDSKDILDDERGSTKPRGWGQARRGWQGRYDSTKRQR